MKIFICGPLQKQENEKLITKDECERLSHANILIWQRWKSSPFLPIRLNSWLQDFSFLSCLSLWLNASPLCQPHILKNVLAVLPFGIYLKLSFLLNLGALGWSRKRSAKLNMTNKLKIFIRRQQPYVLPLSCLPAQSLLPFARNVPSCSPPFKYTYMPHGVMDKFFNTSWIVFFCYRKLNGESFCMRKKKNLPFSLSVGFCTILMYKSGYVKKFKKLKKKRGSSKRGSTLLS